MSEIYGNKTRNALPDSPNEESAKNHMELLESQVAWHRENSTGKFVKPTRMQKAQSGEGLLPSDADEVRRI